ncbi:thiosulfate oxidation carrier complex protein SoxZ [Variovorax sp. PCZ-1]|uniref:thiosulfate oxidation carrier complex protein SoxZ n=1 Tax=Variovorax sp. PCZ-1 TaxID=2835533 RepID=UPI001BD023AB|nr:thiosulfate oxidation carrier complex protein SoxZ [Variovorax sp. PCZ-1]MBS7807129.1 thiosulfate oxidation carrier complex protein SoxZ [Variovorax sp. PCZ-1]
MSDTPSVRSLVQAPATAQRGQVIVVSATIGHMMETGYRRGSDGVMLPRDLIRRFVCTYQGEQVFAATLHAAMSSNPYLSFRVRVMESGTLQLSWTGDKGFSHTRSHTITVA